MAKRDDFDISEFLGDDLDPLARLRYQAQLNRIEQGGKTSDEIRRTVENSLANLDVGIRSFVIYGEPQSGKTEMMICLTAALLDAGQRIIVVLVNDSVQLLEQNLSRFQHSGLDPAPKKFSEVLDDIVKIGTREWIVFCKKNQSDLTKLWDKLKRQPNKVIIDDEADYASPNSKINRAEKTRINELVEKLIGRDGIYIGVTATPARLDLNTTFNNLNRAWVDFKPHPAYTGQATFFPVKQEALENLPYLLEPLDDHGDDLKHLRRALFGFIINTSYLNCSKRRPGNYSFLVHTSGKKADHTVDYERITKIFEVLGTRTGQVFERYVRELVTLATERYGEEARTVVRFALANINQNNVVVMNSDSVRNAADYQKATSPATMFTVAIGGNIVSRGVTFDNLLSMFFTRDSAHQIQQDTYIQRARMFGSRGNYLEWFELTIPKKLFLDWQRCFVFHQLSLSNIRSGSGAPIWLEDTRIKPVTKASINQSAVEWRSGEMYWDKFKLTDQIRDRCASSTSGLKSVQDLAALLDYEALPKHVLDFIENFRPWGEESVVLHPLQILTEAYTTADAEEITREKGLIGTNALERRAFPRAIHHLKVFGNGKGMARVYYKYSPSINDVRVNSRRLTFVRRDS